MLLVQVVVLVVGSLVAVWGLLLVWYGVKRGLSLLFEGLGGAGRGWLAITRSLTTGVFGTRSAEKLVREYERDFEAFASPRKSSRPNQPQILSAKTFQELHRLSRILDQHAHGCRDCEVMGAHAYGVDHMSALRDDPALAAQRLRMTAGYRVLGRLLQAPLVRLDPNVARMQTGLSVLNQVCGPDCALLMLPVDRLPEACPAMQFFAKFHDPAVVTEPLQGEVFDGEPA